MHTKMLNTSHSTGTSYVVDNADWLKTTAIILVAIGHFGYFFLRDPDWWSTFGRMAAPVFFFLMGYAQSRRVPFRWIWLGVGLTLLDSWNNGWAWMAPNILLGMALIRITRPHAKTLILRHGWVAFTVLVCVLIAMLQLAADIVDYGAEGWLWALFGLCQRIYVDSKATVKVDTAAQSPAIPTPPKIGLMRLLACFVAAVVYVWQEQEVFFFSQIQLAVVIIGVGIVSLGLCLFKRGPSRVQPPEPIARTLHFIGWHTLEIYVIQLAGSELLIKFVPSLVP
jgi:peptidoglycan/LPS O-acetylase OafA/YrhL